MQIFTSFDLLSHAKVYKSFKMANAHAFIAVGLVCCVIGAVNAHIFHKLFDDESQLVQVKPDTYALYSTHLRHM